MTPPPLTFVGCLWSHSYPTIPDNCFSGHCLRQRPFLSVPHFSPTMTCYFQTPCSLNFFHRLTLFTCFMRSCDQLDWCVLYALMLHRDRHLMSAALLLPPSDYPRYDHVSYRASFTFSPPFPNIHTSHFSVFPYLLLLCFFFQIGWVFLVVFFFFFIQRLNRTFPLGTVDWTI